MPWGWTPLTGIETIAVHDLGAMDVVCEFCGALHWIDERLTVRFLLYFKCWSCFFHLY